MMRISYKVVGHLKQQLDDVPACGEIESDASLSPRDIAQQLKLDIQTAVMIVVNQDFVSPDDALHHDDQVTFVPTAISGG